jgi:hypothetical protein
MTDQGFDAMSHEQQKQMLEFFMYRLQPEQREELAASLPAAYNAYCGSQIVTVVSTKDYTRSWLPTRTELVNGRFIKVRVGAPQPAFEEPVSSVTPEG